jgi:hypothetical protein
VQAQPQVQPQVPVQEQPQVQAQEQASNFITDITYNIGNREYIYVPKDGTISVNADGFIRKHLSDIQEQLFPNIAKLSQSQAEKIFLHITQQIPEQSFSERMFRNFIALRQYGINCVMEICIYRQQLLEPAINAGFLCVHAGYSMPQEQIKCYGLSIGFKCGNCCAGILEQRLNLPFNETTVCKNCKLSEEFTLRTRITHPNLPHWKEKSLSLVFANDINPMCEVQFPNQMSHPLWGNVWNNPWGGNGLTRDVPLDPQSFLRWLMEMQ